MISIQLGNSKYNYDPKQPLGRRGGFGQAFAGNGPGGTDLAIKKLHLTVADAAHRELKVVGQLLGKDFKYVIPFVDAGEWSGEYFIVMPRAEYSLEQWMADNGQQSAETTAKILFEILSGLVEVGDLIHRDLKPANVLWHEHKWKIADFGIARFVEESTSLNTLNQCLTPQYAAPEQWRLETATHATDVYALGCIGFCLVTGSPPFSADFSESHQRSPVPSFSCNDGRLCSAINLMLAKTPPARPTHQRLQTMLQTIMTQPIGTIGQPFADLANVGAQIAEAEQRQQARFEAEKNVTQTRIELLNNALGELRANLQRLIEKIATAAPNAKMVGGTPGIKIELAGALLEVRFGSSTPIEAGQFIESGWDVLGNCIIAVGQEQPEYVWRASLWYARLKGTDDYRWYEASYFTWSRGGPDQPFALGPGRDADYAASSITHNVNFAFGPVSIDGENEDDFHSRWALLFSMACKRQLRQPSNLPIRNWPPTW